MKKNVKMMVLLELLLLVISLIVIGYWMGGTAFIIENFIDCMSFAGLLVVVVLGLIIIGEWKNFIMAFSVWEKKYSILELKNIIGAVSACQRFVLYVGIMELLLQTIIILSQLRDELLVINANLAVALLTVFYMMILEFLLVPLKVNADKALNEEIDFDTEIDNSVEDVFNADIKE